jgi:Ca-activated chloride channel family protein
MPPSTGGTTEPNDQPYGDVFFQGYGTNPFVDTEDDALSTFGFDVDTGSYGVVRRYLRDGNLPPADAVRVEEIVNAFDYGDTAPRRGTFALSAEGAPSPWPPGERYYLLRLAVKGREIQRAEERPVDLVFVIDTSGSMNYENRLGLVKRALALLLERLGPDDRVALVTYGSRGEVRLPFTRDAETLRWTVERLHPDGATNAEEGLTLAYDLMARQGRRGAVRRVLLCSDGVANVGATGPESILGRIGEGARSGVELTTVGFGMGNYNDVLMEQLADRGNGRYAYVDTLDEARRLFVEELTGTLYSIAAEARAQVEFDPRVVSRYRLIGYENRDIADERFRDDTVDAAEIGSGHTVTALYEVKLREGVRPERGEGRRLGTLRVRFRPIDSERFEEGSLPLDLGILAPSWSSASRAFHLSAVAARFAEILRGSYWARGGDLHELARRAERIAAEWRGEERIAELADLIRRAADLAPEGGGS